MKYLYYPKSPFQQFIRINYIYKNKEESRGRQTNLITRELNIWKSGLEFIKGENQIKMNTEYLYT